MNLNDPNPHGLGSFFFHGSKCFNLFDIHTQSACDRVQSSFLNALDLPLLDASNCFGRHIRFKVFLPQSSLLSQAAKGGSECPFRLLTIDRNLTSILRIEFVKDGISCCLVVAEPNSLARIRWKKLFIRRRCKSLEATGQDRNRRPHQERHWDPASGP